MKRIYKKIYKEVKTSRINSIHQIHIIKEHYMSKVKHQQLK
jgi:hypothetical protein